MQKRDSRTNQQDAKIADKLRRMQEDHQEREEKCTKLSALNAEKQLRFLLNLVMIDLFIAVNAMRQGNNPRSLARGL